MRQRKEEHNQKTIAFINKVGDEVKAKILEEAKSELKKVENLKKVREAEEQRKLKDEKKR